MNAWNSVGESDNVYDGAGISRAGGIQPSRRETGSSFQVKKHAFFADVNDRDDLFASEMSSSSRRKQVSRRKELVLEDNDDGDDDDADSGDGKERESQSSRLDCTLLRSTDTASPVTPESAIPDVIHTVLRSKVSQSGQQQSSVVPALAPSTATATVPSSSTKTTKKKVSLSVVDTPLDTDAFLHYLVRDFLRLHIDESTVLSLFDKEQPPHARVLDDKEAKSLFERVTGRPDTSSSEQSSVLASPSSLLEQFLLVWDEAVHKRRCERPVSSSRRSSSSSSRQSEEKTDSAVATAAVATEAPTAVKKKTLSSSSSSSSSRKKKPVLNVITATEELDPVDAHIDTDGDDAEGDYNRLNRPGSTPKPQGADAAASILGDPGSTPKARASDLKTLGFDEDELRTPVPVENLSSTDFDVTADSLDLSEYAKRKRAAKKHTKRVCIGESGSTPTKEYIFFRETPPSFVTESVEAAVDVLEKLGLDPVFRLAAAVPQERFVELSSSDVGKYRIGQDVQHLGAQRNVSGVVSKIFGSRQCGTSGPGTIVIDTCPESESSDSELASTQMTAAVAPLSAALAPHELSLDSDDEDLLDTLLA